MWTFWQTLYRMVQNQFLLTPDVAWLKTTAKQVLAAKMLWYNGTPEKHIHQKYEDFILDKHVGFAANVTMTRKLLVLSEI